jgi:D-3-phosphoglycerate dehydrogenase
MAVVGPRVRAIGRIGIGLDAIDLEAAKARGIAVVHAPGYATTEVATHTAALILAAQRRIVEADVVGRGTWSTWTGIKPIEPLDEATLGLIGAGRIGENVARLMRSFVKRIIYYDPYLEHAVDWAERVETLDRLLTEVDIVSLHLPLTNETRHLLGPAQLRLMRPGAIIVNTARGLLLDSAAAAAALKAGQLGVVAVDVLESEQPDSDHPLLNAPRTIITPHVAWYSERSARNVRAETVADVISVLDGGEPIHGRRVA